MAKTKQKIEVKPFANGIITFFEIKFSSIATPHDAEVIAKKIEAFLNKE